MTTEMSWTLLWKFKAQFAASLKYDHWNVIESSNWTIQALFIPFSRVWWASYPLYWNKKNLTCLYRQRLQRQNLLVPIRKRKCHHNLQLPGNCKPWFCCQNEVRIDKIEPKIYREHRWGMTHNFQDWEQVHLLDCTSVRTVSKVWDKKCKWFNLASLSHLL